MAPAQRWARGMLTFFFSSLPYALMVAFAFGLAVAGFLQYRLVGRVTPEARLVAVVLTVGLGALLSVALTSRTLDEARIAAGEVITTYSDYASGFAASRWISLLLIAGAVIEIARGWVGARTTSVPDPALPMMIGLIAYYFGTILIQACVSDDTGFSLRSLYVPILLLAVYYQRPRRLEHILSAAKWALLVVTTGSLAAIVLRPDFAMHRPDVGGIPGLDWRLYGLTPHANTLGPIALLAIVLELHTPSRRWPVRWLHLGTAAAAFILAQSKTAWAAAPAMAVAIYLPLTLRQSLDAAGAARRFDRTIWLLLGSIAIVVLGVAAAVGFDTLEFVRRRDDLATLTGRTHIWEITLEAWRENILFGYGPEIWGADRQIRFRMFHVGHAHNQIVQTLGEAGLVGLLLLLGYLGTLFHAALRQFFPSRGLVLMLMLLVLVRCVTEAPLRAEGLLSWATFLHVLLLVAACHAVREPAAPAVASPTG
ncbi:MAG: O-antigen ligase family protein, partial [Chitinophagaceae bacterium]|nr:O-antigen ligase family protein [Rubrivivax sp.]